MKKTAVLFVTLLLSVAGYLAWSYHKLSSVPLEKVILEVVTDRNFRFIPAFVARRYLDWVSIDANGTLDRSPTPYLNFSLFGYRKIEGNRNTAENRKKRLYNDKVLAVAQLLIDRGANVDSIDPKTGWAPLHEAILLNQPEVARFLIRNSADPRIKINMPSSKYHGLDALGFARRMAEETENEDYTEIIKLISVYYQKFDNRNNAAKLNTDQKK